MISFIKTKTSETNSFIKNIFLSTLLFILSTFLSPKVFIVNSFSSRQLGAYSKGGLISQNCFYPWGLNREGGYSKLGAYSIIYGLYLIFND